MKIADFDYHLPEELIAQTPIEKRDESRLMVLNRETGEICHRRFFDVIEYIQEGDCVVFNDSKVIPARIFGTKVGTGAKIEFLLIKEVGKNLWETLAKPAKRLKLGTVVEFPNNMSAEVVDFGEDGTRIVKFNYEGNIFLEKLEEIGSMPLPPYITRFADEVDKSRYQTVYSRYEGSVAAPTAGLHFTDELIKKLEEKGVNTAYVTLHVGIGTFRPVKATSVEEHHMHIEEYRVPKETADLINETKKKGKRVFAVGTTSTRTLESCVGEDGLVKAGSGTTGIFIYPGYEFKAIDSLITNFHLPKSTLLMLISALYEKDKILEAYEIAIKEQYRFFSYGDSMLIL